MSIVLGLDIGSNSVGSAWIDLASGEITVGLSVFPAGVDESDEKRGDPKNAKRRTTRRSRLTLARRSHRKRALRRWLIANKFLPSDAQQFQRLLQETDPWDLRRKALTLPLTPHEFGRVLLHLAQRRGTVGFDADLGDAGQVKAAMTELQLAILARYGTNQVKKDQQQLREQIEQLAKQKKRDHQENRQLENAQDELKKLCKSMLQEGAVTFGRFIADLRDERCTPITTKDQRKQQRGAQNGASLCGTRRVNLSFTRIGP